MAQPETIILVASALWMSAAFVTGVPNKGRFPPEFPALFSIIAFIGVLIGITETVPETLDVIFTFFGVLVFAVTPVVFTAHLYRRYPPNPPPGKPRHLGRTDDDAEDDSRSDGGHANEHPSNEAATYVDGVKIRKPNMTRGGSRSDGSDDSDSEE